VKFTLSSVLLAVLASSTAIAADVSLTGSFTRDDNIQLVALTLTSPSTVTLRTWSYAGGTNAAGATIPEGGFDPYLALFNSTGLLIADNDDGAGVPTSPVTGEAFDALIRQDLGPGSYILALTQYDNYAIGPNLANGFLEQNAGNYTAAFGCSNGRFCDVDGNNRTNFWAVDLQNVASAAVVPEPAPAALCASGLLAAAWLLRRRAGRRV
jgi:hypothetical protein